MCDGRCGLEKKSIVNWLDKILNEYVVGTLYFYYYVVLVTSKITINS